MLVLRRLLQQATHVQCFAHTSALPTSLLSTTHMLHNTQQPCSMLYQTITTACTHLTFTDAWPMAKSAASLQDYSKEDIEHIRARIFGGHVGNGRRTGRQALKRMGKLQDRIANYYPERLEQLETKKVDMFAYDYWYDERHFKLFQRRRRGKYVPKKGQGKRSNKKKK